MQGNGVHRGHGKSGAIDDAADIAIEGDIIQPVRRGLDFLGVFLVEVTQIVHLRLTIEGVAVEFHLRVHREQSAFPGERERIDFDEQGVVVAKTAVERLHELDRCGKLFVAEPQMRRDLAALEIEHPHRRVHRLTGQYAWVRCAPFPRYSRRRRHRRWR